MRYDVTSTIWWFFLFVCFYLILIGLNHACNIRITWKVFGKDYYISASETLILLIGDRARYYTIIIYVVIITIILYIHAHRYINIFIIYHYIIVYYEPNLCISLTSGPESYCEWSTKYFLIRYELNWKHSVKNSQVKNKKIKILIFIGAVVWIWHCFRCMNSCFPD